MKRAEDRRMRQGSILIVDDEPIVLQSLSEWFRDEGYRTDAASSATEALRLVGENDYDIAFVDIVMPDTDGITLQTRLAAASPDLTVVIMTAHASAESAVKALKAGAYDYVTKPFDPEELLILVQRALEHRSLAADNVQLRERVADLAAPSTLVGASASMQRVLDLIHSVAGTDSTVLIKGESGTGKELVARAIHANSPRRYGPMVVVNCGALPEGILESELFGHEKGAFTGAEGRRLGKFEQADGGTIFLDEVGAISPRVQIDLLRVLEDKVVTRLGSPATIGVDFRVIAATNQDLDAMVRTGEFREDLFWRLNVFTIDIPPLRSRSTDIVLLAQHFLDRFTRSMNRKPMQLSPATIAVLEGYSWPGNVRELQNALESAVVLGSPPMIEVEDLPTRISHPRLARGPSSLAESERRHILSVLDSAGWNISRAARILEIDRGTLYNKLEKYGIRRPQA